MRQSIDDSTRELPLLPEISRKEGTEYRDLRVRRRLLAGIGSSLALHLLVIGFAAGHWTFGRADLGAADSSASEVASPQVIHLALRGKSPAVRQPPTKTVVPPKTVPPKPVAVPPSAIPSATSTAKESPKPSPRPPAPQPTPHNAPTPHSAPTAPPVKKPALAPLPTGRHPVAKPAPSRPIASAPSAPVPSEPLPSTPTPRETVPPANSGNASTAPPAAIIVKVSPVEASATETEGAASGMTGGASGKSGSQQTPPAGKSGGGVPFATGGGEGSIGFGPNPARVAYILDISGSMKDNDKIGAARQALLQAIAGLRPGDLFTIILFSDTVTNLSPGLISASDPVAVKRLEDRFAASNPYGETDLSEALDRALVLPGIQRIYLISDGAPTLAITDYDELSNHLRTRNAHGAIRISTFALGAGEQFEGVQLLRRIAEENGGDYRYIDVK